MNDLNRRERASMDAVAKRLSATWEKGGGSGAYLVVAGKRVAVDVRSLRRRDEGTKLRLRFDRVVIRLMDDLQAGLSEIVPVGMTVLVTVTAPIRLPSKTAAGVESKIRHLLEMGRLGRDHQETIHGNGVRIRLLRSGWKRAPRVIGFVHNADSDPILLMGLTCEAFAVMQARGRALRSASDRWLVAIQAGGASSVEAYRYIYSQLGSVSGYQRILMVFGDGRVESVSAPGREDPPAAAAR